jgi:hypothetical protein
LVERDGHVEALHEKPPDVLAHVLRIDTGLLVVLVVHEHVRVALAVQVLHVPAVEARYHHLRVGVERLVHNRA